MNKTFSIILFTFVVTGCGMSQKNAAEPKTEETQVEPTTMVADLPSDSTLIRYFFNLPCVWHKMDEKILAKELDLLEKHADIVPETADGMDAASVEWFGGRKGSLLAHTLMDTDSLWVTVNSISQGNENSIEVKFAYDAYEKSIGMKDGSGTLDMTLICEDGHWVVSDFMADGGRRYTELLNDYIQTQRRYFRSSEWIDELNLRLSFHSNYSKNIPIDVIRSHYFGRMRANIGYYQDANAYIHQYPEPTDGNLPDSLILSLFEAIPGCWGNDSQDGWGEERWDEVRMRAAFSDSLFAEMVEAQTMPDTEYDGIPSNDWMRSFLRRCDEGNDHDDSMRVVGVRSELVNDTLVGIVDVLFHYWEEPTDEPLIIGYYYLHTYRLWLAQEHGRWVIADISARNSKTIRKQLQSFIQQERHTLKKTEWQNRWQEYCIDYRSKLLQDSVANADKIRKFDEEVRKTQEYLREMK